jgi:PPOX class probable FMN-dependent enzyme
MAMLPHHQEVLDEPQLAAPELLPPSSRRADVDAQGLGLAVAVSDPPGGTMVVHDQPPSEPMTAASAHPLTSQIIQTEAQLRALIGEPAALTCAKVNDHLNAMTRRFIERSPFVCIASSDAAGGCDLSPRGDPAGFVRILDERTLLIPERPGNRLADSLRNMLANPHVGLLFIVPGVTDTFRVNGRATITVDAELLAPCAVEGKPPRLGVLVDIDEAYTQCSKAFLRSQLWDPQRFVDPATMPTGGQVHRAIQGDQFDAEHYDSERAERYRRRVGFY